MSHHEGLEKSFLKNLIKKTELLIGWGGGGLAIFPCEIYYIYALFPLRSFPVDSLSDIPQVLLLPVGDLVSL